MPDFSFSYSPKASTALASVNPIQNKSEGLRFAANTPMSFIKQNPEVVAEGFLKGRQALAEGIGSIGKGILSATGSIAGAIKENRLEKKADAEVQRLEGRVDAKLKDDRAHETAIANIKSAQTPEEKWYQMQRNDLLKQQIAEAQTKNQNASAAQETGAVAPRAKNFTDDDKRFPNYVNPAPPPAPPAPPADESAPAAAQTNNRAEELKKDNERIAKVEKIKAFENGAKFQPPEYYNALRDENLAKNAQYQKNLQELNSILAPAPATATAPAPAPASPKVSQSDVDVPNYFSGINLPSPAPVEEEGGYRLADVRLPQKTDRKIYPTSQGQVLDRGETLQLVPVSGGEGTPPPLAGTPAITRSAALAAPALEQKPSTAPQEAESAPTQDEIRYYLEDKYTARPYQSLADANGAKKLLEKKLGVNVEIETVQGEKGTRLHYVKIVNEAPAAKTPPEGYYTESIRDADGKETYVYKPKITPKQQIATFNSNIDKAKVLKSTIEKIEKIAPGYLFAGAGGISGLMKYNPIANDARTTRSLLDTVKGIVGFGELVALKQQGGTLGALSEKELDMLTSLQGSVNPDMDEATFLENIKSMRLSAERLIAGLEDDKKQVANVEKPTNFQSIQTEKPKYKKGDSGLVNGFRYVYDGTKWNRQ